ncbi:hypothetical protein HMPREF7545_0550 [Selenomonas noxia ATCC 43541]|nr:hypothetical protein HMPREF7545_0550 [Selenomonas noxia ATCC 43541]
MTRLRELRFVIKESLPFYFEAHGDIFRQQGLYLRTSAGMMRENLFLLFHSERRIL